jgi:hypothetical protein
VDGPPATLILIAVILLLVLAMSGIWWLQSTMAERGRMANPDSTDRAQRMGELEANRQAATKVARIVAPVSAVALAIVVVIAIFS